MNRSLLLSMLCLLATRALFVGEASQAAEPAAAPCTPQGGLDYVCGPSAVEDLVQVPGGGWILGSGLAERDAPGKIHRIDSRARSWSIAWPADAGPAAHDARRFPACTTPPDTATFSAHGLSLRHLDKGRDELLVVNHGREAVEFFDVDSRNGAPRLAWKGCVAMPSDVYLNSVAALADGGFVATQFYDPGKGNMGTILTGAITGDVLEWHPGSKLAHIAGTSLSGANGIETDGRGRVLYVAAWGSRELLRVDRRGRQLSVQRLALDFAPDNLRWSADHRTLLVAGQKFAAGGGSPVKLEGWRVLRASPDTLRLETVHDAGADVALQGVSIGLEVEGRLWVGTFRGDRIGSLPLHH